MKKIIYLYKKKQLEKEIISIKKFDENNIKLIKEYINVLLFINKKKLNLELKVNKKVKFSDSYLYLKLKPISHNNLIKINNEKNKEYFNKYFLELELKTNLKIYIIHDIHKKHVYKYDLTINIFLADKNKWSKSKKYLNI